MNAQAEVIYQLLEKIGLHDRIFIIAHSMGGPIAIQIAEKLGPRVMGMIYAEGNIDSGDCYFSDKIISRSSIDEWVKVGFDKISRSLKKNNSNIEYAKTFNKAGPIPIYKSSLDLVKISNEDTLLNRLDALSIPVLVVFGNNNRGVYESEKRLAEKFPIVFIPNAGHNMMLENPDAFYNEIIKFINRINPMF